MDQIILLSNEVTKNPCTFKLYPITIIIMMIVIVLIIIMILHRIIETIIKIFKGFD